MGVGPYKGYEIGFWGNTSNQNNYANSSIIPNNNLYYKLATKPISSEIEAEAYEV